MYVARASRFFFARPPAVPTQRVYSHPVYALKASGVADVMVNSRLIVRGRGLLPRTNSNHRHDAQRALVKVPRADAGLAESGGGEAPRCLVSFVALRSMVCS